MIALLWTALLLSCFFILAYQRASLSITLITLALYLLCFSFLSSAHLMTIIVFWTIATSFALILSLSQLRQFLFTRKIFAFYCKAMPALSATEEEVLNAGSVGWEAELFTGMPDWNKLKAMPGPALSEEERAFIDGPVQDLCVMMDPWVISKDRKLPPEIWNFLKAHGFFGLIIPKEYGGKAFSALGHSEVIAKVASINVAVATVISVPNSLGPAELLLRYGTEEQKNHYLPRLAQGLEIPCFALTSPTAGSDAGSITDSGVVCRRFNNGISELGIRLNWNKRYITLAPVATLLGLAFKLYDPEHLLGSEEELGITCALIPAQTEGVHIGRRHLPLNAAFPNGPTQGQDVFIPLDWIIGGAKQAGQGWRMLMECLAAGRGISLPSITCGGAKKSALASGAYVRIRRQFHVPIESFGGVEEVLARMAAEVYLLEATRLFTVNALDYGAPSAIAAAISKYHCTELGRSIVQSAMDLHGGKAICMGPHNYLAQTYIETPIGITVEGANILTRSMIIFGQGAMRGHLYLLAELQAAHAKDLAAFDKALLGHITSVISNFVRTLVLANFSKNCFMGLFRRRTQLSRDQYFKQCYQRLNWFSAAFALLTDFSVLILQSKLKFKEKISGRLGDILSNLYMASAVLNYHRDSEDPDQELPVAQWVLEDLFFKIQATIQELFQNLAYAKFLRFIVFPRGLACKPPSDHMGAQVADLLSTPSILRNRIANSTYISPENNNLVGKMDAALAEFIASEALEHQLHQARRKGLLKGRNYQEQIESAVAAQVLKPNEAEQLLKLDALRQLIINVDDFNPSEV